MTTPRWNPDWEMMFESAIYFFHRKYLVVQLQKICTMNFSFYKLAVEFSIHRFDGLKSTRRVFEQIQFPILDFTSVGVYRMKFAGMLQTRFGSMVVLGSMVISHVVAAPFPQNPPRNPGSNDEKREITRHKQGLSSRPVPIPKSSSHNENAPQLQKGMERTPPSPAIPSRGTKPRLVVQAGHFSGVTSVVFSRDGKTMFTAGFDGMVHVWDASTQAELGAFEGQGGPISDLAVSPDGKRVVAAGYNQAATVLDVETGSELLRLDGHMTVVQAVAYSPDGQVIATSDGVARLWDASNGRSLMTLDGESKGRESKGGESKGGKPSRKKQILSSIGKEILKQLPLPQGKSGQTKGSVADIFSGLVPVGATAMTFSSDGKYLLTAGGDTAGLWEVDTGKIVKNYRKTPISISRQQQSSQQPDSFYSVGFSTDENYVFAGGWGGTCMWERESMKLIKTFPETAGWGITALGLSPDGRYLVTATSSSGHTPEMIRVWEIATSREVWHSEEPPGVMHAALFTPDGKFVFTTGGNISSQQTHIQQRDAVTGSKIEELGGLANQVGTTMFSPDNRWLLISSNDGKIRGMSTVTNDINVFSGKFGAISPQGNKIIVAEGNLARLCSMETGTVLQELHLIKPQFSRAWFSPNGNLVLIESLESNHGDPDSQGSVILPFTLQVFDCLTGAMLQQITRANSLLQYACMSADGKSFITDTLEISRQDSPYSSLTIQTWDIGRGVETRRFTIPKLGNPMSFITPDGKTLIVGSMDFNNIPNLTTTIQLWDILSGQQTKQFSLSGLAMIAGLTPDQKYLITNNSMNFGLQGGSLSMDLKEKVQFWDLSTGRESQGFDGIGNILGSTSVSSDGKYLVSSSQTHFIKIFELATRQEVCSLITFRDGDWIVVTPEGRFDTNNLEEIKGAHWVMPDDPTTPLSLVSFAQDYYEPRLLSRLLAEEELKPVRDISTLIRARPSVSISNITLDSEDTVKVSVEVSRGKSKTQRDANGALVETGIWDFRLFRDGQLVGYAPQTNGEIQVDPRTGRQTLTFSHIRLPRKNGTRQVEFSAYALNDDRIKSETDRKVFDIPSQLVPLRGRAYVITVGVNSNENPKLELRYAANDARQFERILANQLRLSGKYEEIVPISLISDQTQGAARESNATKAKIKGVLDLLAGKETNPGLLKGVANSSKLRLARPEDFILISFASHGYADTQGNFYLVPYDTGTSEALSAEFLQHCISSEELSFWLRNVDAGDLTMIIDACHSSAAIEGNNFKPGPMGSRGLGQLSYDKGMRILAATQANNFALENNQLEQGLLSFALVKNGLEQGQADFKPADQIIWMREWLQFGVKRVPELYADVMSGKLRLLQASSQLRTGSARAGRSAKNRQGRAVIEVGKVAGKTQVQTPGLFDFVRRTQDLILVHK